MSHAVLVLALLQSSPAARADSPTPLELAPAPSPGRGRRGGRRRHRRPAPGRARIPVTRPEKADGFFLRGQATGKEQAVHTATDVPISAYARNPFAWMPFVGVQRNTDVFFKIAEALGRE